MTRRSPTCPNCGGYVLVPGSDHYIGGRWTCTKGRRQTRPSCEVRCDDRGHTQGCADAHDVSTAGRYPSPGVDLIAAEIDRLSATSDHAST